MPGPVHEPRQGVEPVALRSDQVTRRLLLELQEHNSFLEHGAGGKDTTLNFDSAVAKSDPNKGQFDGRAAAKGRILRAIVEPSETRPGFYRVTLTVASTRPDVPLTGRVTFVLHPTLKEPRVELPVVNGFAVLVLMAYGAFTVGVEADGGRTRLELDLATLTDAPEAFLRS